MADGVSAHIDQFEMRRALGYPQRCSEEVSRSGNAEPCDKPAVALREDPNYGGYYPVCARHARASMVSLEVIVRFLLERQQAQSLIAEGLLRMAMTEEGK